jgi:hypothetical protein
MSPPLDPAQVFRQLPALLPGHWRRRRGRLGPPQVVLSLMVMTVLGTKGYERTLDEMKRQLGRVLGWRPSDDVPSASALCQARRKLDAKACAELVSQVYALCTTARSCAAIGYGGFRLLAMDGTKLPLPAYAALVAHFGCPTQGEGKELSGPQASLTILWDVGANQPVAWRVGPYLVSEQAHALELVSALGAGDLLLGDRNFPSRRLLTLVRQRGAQVLMRVRSGSTGTLREVAAFLASGATDSVVDLESRDEHDQPDPTEPALKIRLLRAVLPDGSSAVYLTSLTDAQQHPAQALIDLYAQRWRIETAFREMKIWHGLERFHARHVDGIAQEITAIMIFQLLASELEAQVRKQYPDAQPPPDPSDSTPRTLQRPNIRFNRRIVADSAINLVFSAASGQDLAEAFTYELYRIWRYRQKFRPGRSFPRRRKSPPRGWKTRGTKGKGRP